MSLQVISHFWEANFEFKSYKAPSGFMYKIKAISYSNYATVANQLIIVASLTEDRLSLTRGTSDSIQEFDCQIDGAHYYVLFPPEGIKTKYISMAPIGVANITGTVHIYYVLEKASVAEQIWEFLKRGKNP